MTRQYLRRSNQSHRESASSILQRTGVRSIPVTASQVNTEPEADDKPRLKQDWTQVPVRNPDRPVVQPPLRIGKVRSASSHNISECSVSPVGGQPIQHQHMFGELSHELRGDRSFENIVQAKLTIGQTGDKYEQEADRVASEVVDQINVPSRLSTQHESHQPQQEQDELIQKPMLQLQSVEGGMAATPELESSIQQARGTGKPLPESICKPMEQSFGGDFSGVKVHSDSQSDKLNQSMQARAFTTGKDIFFRQGEYNPGSRDGQTQQEQDELIQKPMLQLQSVEGGMAATPELESSIQQARGTGKPLPESICKPMEQSFGGDFSGVKVHSDSQSDKLNQSMQARAFTTGKDIFFRQGEYNPGSRDGQRLIAHELTHVVQQSSGDVQISRMPKKDFGQEHDGRKKSLDKYKKNENDLWEKIRELKLEGEEQGDFYRKVYEDYNLEEDETYYSNLIEELKKKEQKETNEELSLLLEELDRIGEIIEKKIASYGELLNRIEEVQGPDPFEQAEEREAEELKQKNKELNRALKDIRGRKKEIKHPREMIKQRYKEERSVIGDRYKALDEPIDQRKYLENKGVMLLPSNMPLAGIFPSSESKNYNRWNKEDRYPELVKHAEYLVKRYRLYNKKDGGILRNEKEGCVCIMYIKEGELKKEEGASYRPAFGISGLKPSGGGQAIPQERALTGMGVPGDTTADFDARVDKLKIDLERREKMKIKIPSVQAVLAYLQFPFDNSIERWSPVQCAEPRIVMAVYQLYHRPADLALSVPFEHGLKDGKVLEKYTCSRCAISESKFAAPKEGGGREIVNMGIRAKDLESGEKEPTEKIKEVLGRENLTRKGQPKAYNGEKLKAMIEQYEKAYKKQFFHR